MFAAITVCTSARGSEMHFKYYWKSPINYIHIVKKGIMTLRVDG